MKTLIFFNDLRVTFPGFGGIVMQIFYGAVLN